MTPNSRYPIPSLQARLLCVLTLLFSSPLLAVEVTPETFAGSDGLLDKQEVTEYMLSKLKVTYDRITTQSVTVAETATAGSELQAQKYAVLANRLLELEERFRDGPPWKPDDVDAFLAGKLAARPNHSGLSIQPSTQRE